MWGAVFSVWGVGLLLIFVPGGCGLTLLCVSIVLSLSDSVGFFISCVISVLIWTEFSSILLMNSLLVLIAAESRESLASFSASHHTCICSLVGLVPRNVNFMLI